MEIWELTEITGAAFEAVWEAAGYTLVREAVGVTQEVAE